MQYAGGVTKASHSRSNADCLTKDQCQTVPLQSKSDKGAASLCKVVDVLIIVVTQAKELLYMLDACQNRPLSDGLKLGWICTNGAGTNNMPKILNRLLKKGTLLQFGTKTFVTKMLEDYMEMGKMVAKQLTEHQDIIQVYNHEVVKNVKKGLIHQMLKSRGGIGQSEGHNNPFKEAKMHQECRAWLVCWCNLYLVIPLGQVHL